MLCNNCHSAIEETAKFCSHCGHPASPHTSAQSEKPSPALKRPYTPRRQNAEHGDPYLGYLLMAAFSVFHVIVWQLYTKINSNWSSDDPLRDAMNFLWVVDWLIMLAFAKKMVYRLLISLFFAIVLGFNIYNRYLHDLF